MTTTILVAIGTFLVLLGTAQGFLAALSRYYIVPGPHEALLLTGSRGTTVAVNKPVFAVPLVTQVTRVPLGPVIIKVEAVALAQGGQEVGVSGQAVVAVDPSTEGSIKTAAMLLCGTERAFDVEVREKLHWVINSAVRLAIHSYWKPGEPGYTIEEAASAEMFTDAAKLGLRVLSVSLPVLKPVSVPDILLVGDDVDPLGDDVKP